MVTRKLPDHRMHSELLTEHVVFDSALDQPLE
jgi:hypothetical protein